MRRSGKSFLLFNLFVKQLKDNCVDDNHIIAIDLEDYRNVSLRKPDELLHFVDSKIVDDSMYYLLIDEVQRLDFFEEVLNSFLQKSNVDVYVTGSNARFLSRDVITIFRGRSDEVRVHPFCFKEFMSTQDSLNQEQCLRQYLTYGGMPQASTMNSDEQRKIYLQDLFTGTYLRDIKKYYDMSWLTLKFPGLKLGYDALCTLYDNLGRRQTQVLSIEQDLINSSSREVAIDGHVIASQSDNNDLAEKGYKFSSLNEKQINLMMAYDVHTDKPLLSRIYQGGLNDSISIRDFLRQVTMRDMLFIVDKGFYSLQNLALFNENGNYYLIPVPSRMDICKTAELDSKKMERFSYATNRKATVIEYSVKEYDGFCVYAFRDKDEALLQESNYLRYLEHGKQGYTQEGLEKNRDFFGVYILQTNLKNRTPSEIFGLYKKRWKIETFYNYFKNGADYNALYTRDYYKTQGLSFIMLISSLIHHELAVSTKKIKNKTTHECLLDARMIKINKRNGVWIPANCKAAIADLFRSLDTPLSVS